MMSIRRVISIFSTLLVALSALQWAEAQPTTDPTTPSKGLAPLRSEFISYSIRELADGDNLDKNEYYLPLEFNIQSIEMAEGEPMIDAFFTSFEVPFMWLDRDVFLRVEGFEAFDLIINNRLVGYGEDARIPSEFSISPYIADGENSLMLIPKNSGSNRLETQKGNQPVKSAYIFSQPKVRIHDYNITFVPDSVENCGVFTVEVLLSNSYNSDEEFDFGYDVYSPQNKLEHFDMRPVRVAANSIDTVRISQKIWRTPGNEWRAEKPGLYYGMLIIRKDKRMIEYIPYAAGYGTTEVRDGKVYRNGEPIDIKAVDYTANSSKQNTRKELNRVKRAGYNTIYTYYPQPEWFYGECSKIGLYVIDRANIYSDNQAQPTNRMVGGGLSNDPNWVNTFLERVGRMQLRSKHHDCIIGWSIGGGVGNGYNMYRSYQLLKELEPNRAVIYDSAEGEWNSDLEPINSIDSSQVLK